MQKFINNPENLTSELLEGLVLSNPDIITLEQGNLIVNKKLAEADRVTIVTLGGTGHEPAISGFVGGGMFDTIRHPFFLYYICKINGGIQILIVIL